MALHVCLLLMGFPGGSESKESTCNVGDLGSIPGHGKVLQDSCLENSRWQRSLAGYSPWGSQRAGHDWATKLLISSLKLNKKINVSVLFTIFTYYMHDLGFLTGDWTQAPRQWKNWDLTTGLLGNFHQVVLPEEEKNKKKFQRCVIQEKLSSFIIFLFENTFTEIQFTYHKIYPFKVYKSMTLVHLEYTNITKTWIQNIFITSKRKAYLPLSKPTGNHQSTFYFYRFAYSGHFI